MAKTKQAPRMVLDGNISVDARTHLKEVMKSHPEISEYRICKESGVARNILKRILAGEKTTDETLDKLGKWIEKNKL